MINRLRDSRSFYILLSILLAVLVSFLTGAAVPVFTWMVLEKSGTVVERIRGII